MLQDGLLGVPEADPLPGDDVNTPYYVIGDDLFALNVDEVNESLS